MAGRLIKLIFIVPLAILGMILFAFIGGEIVLHLWNWLLPSLFGWRELTFWQAVGLLALCRILFGGFGWHRPRRYVFRDRTDGRCSRLTPEERERFRQRVRERIREYLGVDPSAPKPEEH
jgi:MFS family permease